MRVVIFPSEVEGRVRAPPSKSYTHRAFFAGLLSSGVTKLDNALVSNDTSATLRAVSMFGAEASWRTIKSEGLPKEPDNVIDCASSATTLRFSMAVASLVDGLTILTGSRSLISRPVGNLARALKQLGVTVITRRDRPPVVIRSDGLRDVSNCKVEIDGRVSSQFISALLLIGPKIGLVVRVRGWMKSRPYVDITVSVLSQFGIDVQVEEDYSLFSIERQDYTSTEIRVPGDYSSASYLLAAGAISGSVRVEGLMSGDVQGDRRIVDILKEMGARVRTGMSYVEVKAAPLRGISINCTDIPDLVPVIAILGAYADGQTKITGAEHLRFKETDRLRNLSDNLKRMGIAVEERADGLVITGGRPTGGVLDSRGDHRIAMALSVAGLRAKGSTVILGAECISDSYPGFFNDLARIGVEMVLE